MESDFADDLRFVADRMLGKLARLLRTLSFDTEYPDFATDNELVTYALFNGRILLTKDGGIRLRDRLKLYHVRETDPRRQLLEVLVEFNQLDYCRSNLDRRLFTRCIECNVPLVCAPKEEARNLVPAYVFETNRDFAKCPRCEKLFWAGTHFLKASEDIRSLL
jgi:uncharacterized protein